MTKKPVVRIEDVPPLRVAYVKHRKGYEDSAGIGEAFETLFCWAGPRGVMGPDMRVMGMPLDNPDITPKDKCRYYACVTVNERAEPDGRVGIMTIRPGAYAVGRFEGGRDVFKKAYAYMYGEWLARSGWQPDDSQLALSTKFVPLIGALLDQACGPTTSLASVTIGQPVDLTGLTASWKEQVRAGSATPCPAASCR